MDHSILDSLHDETQTRIEGETGSNSLLKVENGIEDYLFTTYTQLILP